MAITKSVSLTAETHAIAADMNNFSGFVQDCLKMYKANGYETPESFSVGDLPDDRLDGLFTELSIIKSMINKSVMKDYFLAFEWVEGTRLKHFYGIITTDIESRDLNGLCLKLLKDNNEDHEEGMTIKVTAFNNIKI